MLKHAKAEVALLFGAIFFALNAIPAKLLMASGLSAWRLTELRTTGAFLLILVIVLIKNPKSLRITKSELPLLIAFGLVGFAFVNVFYFAAVSKMQIGIALIIEFTAPIWITLWLRFARRKHVSSLMWWGLTTAFAGLVLLSQIWQGLTINGIGLIYAFIDAFSLSIYFLLGENLLEKKPNEVIMVWGLGVSSLFFAIVQPWWNFPFSVFTKQVALEGRYSGQFAAGFLLVLWLISMGTVVPYFLVFRGLHKLSASTASVIGMLEPIFGGIFGWWFLRESLSTVQLLGAAVVLVGIYLADRAKLSATVA
jgi:drug/metabolite transporter (DMT)-like permease